MKVKSLIPKKAYPAALNVLVNAHKHCDGLSKPKDFIEGPSVPDLAESIMAIINSLEGEGLAKKSPSQQMSAEESAIETFSLEQNYPNPFNPMTEIRFSLPEEQIVKLIVTNMAGQTVRKLMNQRMLPGSHSVIWDGNDDSGSPVTSGIYLYKIQTASFSGTKKMSLIR